MPIYPGEIVTNALRLRRLRKTDTDAFIAMNADLNVMEFFPRPWSPKKARLHSRVLTRRSMSVDSVFMPSKFRAPLKESSVCPFHLSTLHLRLAWRSSGGCLSLPGERAMLLRRQQLFSKQLSRVFLWKRWYLLPAGTMLSRSE